MNKMLWIFIITLWPVFSLFSNSFLPIRTFHWMKKTQARFLFWFMHGRVNILIWLFVGQEVRILNNCARPLEYGPGPQDEGHTKDALRPRHRVKLHQTRFSTNAIEYICKKRNAINNWGKTSNFPKYHLICHAQWFYSLSFNHQTMKMAYSRG